MKHRPDFPSLPRSLTLSRASTGSASASTRCGRRRGRLRPGVAAGQRGREARRRVGGERAADPGPVSALIERMEDRSTITLMSDGLAQLRGRARQAAAEPA